MYEKYKSDFLNVAWVAIPSLIYSLVVHNLVICIDPFVVQAVERILPSRPRIALRIGWLFSFGVGLLSAWNILPGSYAFYWNEALPFTPTKVVVSVAVVSLLLLWLQFHRGAQYQSIRFSRAVALIGVILFAVKASAGIGLTDYGWIRQNLKSPALGLMRTVFYMSSGSQAPVNGTPALTFNAFVRGKQPLPPKVVVMLVESWGERPETLKQMGSSLQSGRLRMLDSGFTTYRGSTLSGEFRELCSQYLSPSDDLKNGDFRLDCAPAFLQRQGYRTFGLHGYQKAFYARNTFWNRFGIADRLFNDNLPGLEQCPGTFEGICDTALIKRGIDLLNRDSGLSFVYMLTLSGHEPLVQSALIQPSAHFKGIGVVHPTQIVSRRAISDLVVELERKQDRPCTLVYIAGDHQPPSASSQSGVFQNNQVPFLTFTYNCPPVRKAAT